MDFLKVPIGAVMQLKLKLELQVSVTKQAFKEDHEEQDKAYLNLIINICLTKNMANFLVLIKI